MAKPKLELDRKEFLRWLEEQPPEAVVGITHHTCICPLANYLGAKYGLELTHRDVGYRYSHILSRSKQHYTVENPRWAMHFIERIDQGPQVILREEAIKVLKGCR